MNYTTEPIHVRVPCSTSNLGPGFDCIGCALQLYNEFHLSVSESARENSIRFKGSEGASLRPSPSNLLFHAASKLFQSVGAPTPVLCVEVDVNVPNARGLGSSSTAIVAGLVAANVLCGEPYDRNGIVRLATAIEGHPDNVTPATLGGLTASLYAYDGRVITSRWKVHPSIAFVVLSPDYEVATKSARGALPQQIPHSDAVANLARVPLLIDALVNGRLDDLHVLMQDRLHEPYREKLYPRFAELKRAVIDAGAASVCLSGAGPSILAVVAASEAESIAAKWVDALHSYQLTGRARVLPVDNDGCQTMKVARANTD